MPTLNPITLLLGGSSLVLLIALGVQTYRINSFATETAQAQTEAAQARSRVDTLRATVAETIASNERARLDNQIKNDQELALLRAQSATLQATLNQKQADYNRTSAQLRSAIANAPKADSRALGPTMLRLLDGLRQRQQEWHGNNVPAAPRTN